MITELTPEERFKIRKSDEAWLDAQPPLPTAEEIARPFAVGLARLHDLRDRADALRWGADAGHRRAEAEEMLALIARVCTMVRVAAVSCSSNSEAGARLAQVVRDVVDLQDLESTIYGDEVYLLGYPDA